MRKYFPIWIILLVITIPLAVSKTSVKKVLANKAKGKTNVERYLTEKSWQELFPNRHSVSKFMKAKGKIKKEEDFYSYKAFVKAAKKFPQFLSEGNEVAQKQELSAFLANIAQETSGGWEDAPGGYYKWGLYFLEEQNCEDGCDLYSDTSRKNWPPVKGASYHGRGPKQLTWNYNYGQFSEAYFGNKDSLLRNPELLATDPVVSFASAIWFWMTPQRPKPSCHDIMVGKWIPSSNDSLCGRLPGFGTTVNIINGGMECGRGEPMEKTKCRYGYYAYFCKYFKVPTGLNCDCDKQQSFKY
jgi:basic endochitinase B